MIEAKCSGWNLKRRRTGREEEERRSVTDVIFTSAEVLPAEGTAVAAAVSLKEDQKNVTSA